jgi:prepilin peptidase CpaA
MAEMAVLTAPALTLPTLAIGLALGLLMAAAWYDLALRIIPDRFCVLLAVLGVAFRLQSGLIDLAFSVITSLLLFFLLFIVFTRGIIGGGDVKLAAAIALWLSPADCYMFLTMTALAGGVLALVHLVLRRILARSPLAAGVAAAGVAARRVPVGRVGRLLGLGRRIIRVERKRIAAGQPLPYGVALAAGGGYTLLHALGG